MVLIRHENSGNTDDETKGQLARREREINLPSIRRLVEVTAPIFALAL